MHRDGVELIGHRGVARKAPENTVASFRAAAHLGLNHIEFDVRLTADNQLAVIHDATLDRTTDGTGSVRKTPSGQIAQLDAGSWFSEAFKNERVPLLRNALSETTMLGLTTNVEIKAESSDEAAFVGDLVTRTIARISDRSELIYVSSFWESALVAATCAAPGVDRALIVDEIPENWPDRMANVGARALHAKADVSNFPMMERVIRAGVLLRCYTVNDIFLANRLFRLGVSAVFTDDPESLRPQ